MSVTVKDMKIPENCWECIKTDLNIAISVFGGMCPFCEKNRTDHDRQTGRHPDCPLTAQSEKRTETHACDCIERQAAINEIKEIYEWHDNVTKERIIEHFKRLPSAQPEMIKEIRKWINSGNRGYADYFIVDKIEEIINKYE